MQHIQHRISHHDDAVHESLCLVEEPRISRYVLEMVARGRGRVVGRLEGSLGPMATYGDAKAGQMETGRHSYGGRSMPSADGRIVVWRVKVKGSSLLS